MCLEVGIFTYIVSNQTWCGSLFCVACVTLSSKVKYAKYIKGLSLVLRPSTKTFQADRTEKNLSCVAEKS